MESRRRFWTGQTARGRSGSRSEREAAEYSRVKYKTTDTSICTVHVNGCVAYFFFFTSISYWDVDGTVMEFQLSEVWNNFILTRDSVRPCLQQPKKWIFSTTRQDICSHISADKTGHFYQNPRTSPAVFVEMKWDVFNETSRQFSVVFVMTKRWYFDRKLGHPQLCLCQKNCILGLSTMFSHHDEVVFVPQTNQSISTVCDIKKAWSVQRRRSAVLHRFSRSRFGDLKTSPPTTWRSSSCSCSALRPSPPAFLLPSCPHIHPSSEQADQTKADIVTAHLSHSLNLFFFLSFVLCLPPAWSSQQKIFSHWI